MPCHLKLSAAQLGMVADYVESLGAVGVSTDTKTVGEARAFCARVGTAGDWPAVPRSNSALSRCGSVTLLPG